MFWLPTMWPEIHSINLRSRKDERFLTKLKEERGNSKSMTGTPRCDFTMVNILRKTHKYLKSILLPM